MSTGINSASAATLFTGKPAHLFGHQLDDAGIGQSLADNQDQRNDDGCRVTKP
jgi:hypothetical protein